MCTSPIKIPNRSKYFRPNVTRPYINVPCSHCADCHQHLGDQWFLRSHQEVLDCLSSGGRAVFTTLTYSNTHLPHFDNLESNPSCFSYRDQKRFIGQINKYFERYVPGFQYGIDFRYIIFPERGKDKSPYEYNGTIRYTTYRPHYHAILYFGKRVVDFLELGCILPSTIEDKYKKLIERAWTIRVKRPVFHPFKKGYQKIAGVEGKWINKSVIESLGQVRWSDKPKGCPSGIFITKEYASIYASKYAVKDVGFFNDKNIIKFYEQTGLSKEDFREKYHECFPHHHQSNHFGLGLTSYFLTNGEFDPVKFEKIYLDGYDFQFSQNLQKGKTVFTKFPPYITNRFITDKVTDDYDNIFIIPNALGIDIRTRSIERRINNLSNQLYNNLHSTKLDKLFIVPQGHWTDKSQYEDYIRDLMSDCTFNDIAFYSLCAAGVLVDVELFERCYSLPMSELKDTLMQRYLWSLDQTSFGSEYYHPDGYFVAMDKAIKDGTYSMKELYKNFRSLDDLPQFYNCKMVLDSITDMYGRYRAACHDDYIRKREENKLLDNLLYNQKHLNYY